MLEYLESDAAKTLPEHLEGTANMLGEWIQEFLEPTLLKQARDFQRPPLPGEVARPLRAVSILTQRLAQCLGLLPESYPNQDSALLCFP